MTGFNFEQNLADVWVYDVARGFRTRLTLGPTVEAAAVWSPDGQQLVFSANRKDRPDFDLFVKPASGIGAEEFLFSGAQPEAPESWSPDGRFIAYVSPWALIGGPERPSDLWVLPLFGDRKPVPFLQTPFTETQAKFSPDGRWLAFVSNESRRNEVYVARFPSPDAKWQLSTAGGSQPRWRSDGTEIFYIAGGNRLMAAAVKSESSVEVSVVRSLFTIRPRAGAGRAYDVSADGQRFLVNALVDVPEPPVTLVVNWVAGLAR